MFTKATTTEDLIASIYSFQCSNFHKMTAFMVLEARCGRESAVKHWTLAGNGEASMPPAGINNEAGRVTDDLKANIKAYLNQRLAGRDSGGFVPDTWGRIELEGKSGDYREIVVAGYRDGVRLSFVINTYDTGKEVRICGYDEIVRRARTN